MMKLKTVFALLLTVCFCTSAHAAHNLSNFDPGSYVTGPKFSGKDIKGKVVVIEYWGITCGPCLSAIPHTTELAKKYGHDKLVIIANQSWSASDKNVKETWNKHAKNNMVMLVNRGKLKGFDRTGVPYALVFDHTGKSIWEGHPGAMDKAIADAVANLPEPVEEPAEQEATEDAGPALIVEGLEPEYFLGETRLINAQNRNIASTVAKLRRAADRSSRQEQMDEAKVIVAAVEAWVKTQQAKADNALASDPATAYVTAEKLVELLEGDELAKPAAAIIDQIEKDKKGFSSVRATIALRGILAEAKSIGLDRDKSAADEKKNARSIRLITRDLGRLIKAYPDTDAGKQAKALQSEWDLGE
jgi:thiol-disulfide isomerase/thioredoxin